MTGKLILGATPIGNLGDVSHRLLETIQSADELWCEDTRITRKILSHFGLKKTLRSFHEYSDQRTTEVVKTSLQNGRTLLYMSDAGMPGVADPGFELVRLAREIGSGVDVIPGPSAVLTALVLSGLPCHEFAFMGFFPEKEQAQLTLLKRLKELAMTTIYFESPKRIKRTLLLLKLLMPQLEIAVCRELTKMHQSIYHGKPETVLNDLDIEKGEIALVLGPVTESLPELSAEAYYQKLIETGSHPREALKKTAKLYKIQRRELYDSINK